MELRQLRYFVSVVEHRSMGKAALELGLVTSALSQQISRLEGELCTRLLQRTSTGVVPTDAGLAFWRQAQLALRHADAAAAAARHARLTGYVSVGLAQSTAGIIGVRFMQAMRSRYPDVKVRIVESLSGYLSTMLSARQIDLAVLFREEPSQRWSRLRLLKERLFLIGLPDMLGIPFGENARISQAATLPLILPSGSHGLRSLLARCFEHSKADPNVVAEVDGLGLLMRAVRAGIGVTIQPGSILAPDTHAELSSVQFDDDAAQRENILISLSEDELSPAALATRIVLADVIRSTVSEGRWPGATLVEAGNRCSAQDAYPPNTASSAGSQMVPVQSLHVS
ncbi:LysR family transcriptional regulator [Cupriavidus pinatubonensis]|uniref:LysR family transcriptional regulator n=1 Tax=Cupriavidus pinatubonensis TaxID=248026 RepID=UPI00112E7CF1|nr:LysR family transcriptional regulator [Cupriavidus pinatubonensis]TPQ38252.1 LysR family transcriptional regulator [Cupriavidus pinatubonensis]